MILNIDTTNKEFVVTKNPYPKVDTAGVQRADKFSGQPLWATQVVVTDADGGEVINITTAGEQPDVDVGDPVDLTGLVAIPWTSNNRSGTAYRADTIVALE